MRNINAILDDLQACALKNADLTAHLNKIQFHLRDNNHKKILVYIQEGLNQFKSNNAVLAWFSLNNNHYANFLLELKNHFVILPPDNSTKKVQILINAIQTTDTKNVEEVLDTGSAFIINEPNAEGVLPIIAALLTKNLATIKLLMEKGATLNAVVEVNKPINDQGDTLLHITVLLGLNQFIEELLIKHADVNMRNVHGATPLYNAIENSQADIARLLLNKQADPSIPYGEVTEKFNAFMLALYKKEYKLASQMLMLGYKARYVDLQYLKNFISDNDEAKYLYRQIKISYTQQKKLHASG